MRNIQYIITVVAIVLIHCNTMIGVKGVPTATVNNAEGSQLTAAEHFYTVNHLTYDLPNQQHVQASAGNGPIAVQPYNIFDSIAICPPGYIFVHAHCHKQVKSLQI